VPLIPALQEFCYNYGNSDTHYANGILYPISQTNLDANHQFCGLNASTAASAGFQTLTFNQGWLIPTETGDDIGPFDDNIKHARIRRWSVPSVGNTAGLNSLTSFLGFVDNVSFDWMKHILSTAEIANRFFPGSGNLAQVSPLTTLGMATRINYDRPVARAAADDSWYHERSNFTFAFNGYSNTESGLLDTKMALTVSSNATYTVNVVPAVADRTDPVRNGPYFNDDAQRAQNFETRATPITEGSGQVDPARRFLELATRLYDNRAGRN